MYSNRAKIDQSLADRGYSRYYTDNGETLLLGSTAELFKAYGDLLHEMTWLQVCSCPLCGLYQAADGSALLLTFGEALERLYSGKYIPY